MPSAASSILSLFRQSSSSSPSSISFFFLYPRAVTSRRRRLSSSIYNNVHHHCLSVINTTSSCSLSFFSPGRARSRHCHHLIGNTLSLSLSLFHSQVLSFPNRTRKGMKIATLQFAPRLGDVQGNMRRADALLKLKLKRHTTKTTLQKDDEFGGAIVDDGQPGVEELRPDILVLPELAFTGYNFPSLQAIKPYLETQGKGPTAQWARETARYLKCKVCVGYPEISKAKAEQESHSNGHDVTHLSETDKCFNSLLVVDENGEILLNYRKQFLYYTDERWALEGDVGWGLCSLEFDYSQKLLSNEDQLYDSPSDRKQHVPTSFGICMDINPYRFEAPFTAWEFANQVLASQSQLVILSTAWLNVDDGRDKIALGPDQPPDMDTFQYWIRRFWPLIERRMTHDGDIDCHSTLSLDNTGTPQYEEKRIILVFANRTGVEKGIEGVTRTATYAGTSTIVAISQKLPVRHNVSNDRGNGVEDTSPKPLDVKILCWDIKGATEEGICFADTMSEPSRIFTLVKVSDDDVS